MTVMTRRVNGFDYTVKTDNRPRLFSTWLELPPKVREEDFDYANPCEGHESLSGEHMGETTYCDGSCEIDATRTRFFRYRGSWYDLDEFESGLRTSAGDNVRALGFDAWQPESAFSAVVLRFFDKDGELYLDGDGAVVGYIFW